MDQSSRNVLGYTTQAVASAQGLTEEPVWYFGGVVRRTRRTTQGEEITSSASDVAAVR